MRRVGRNPGIAPSGFQSQLRQPRRVVRVDDLLRQKIRAGSDPARRRSKRFSDLVDAQGLLEAYPALRGQLTAEELAVLDQLPF